MKLRCEPSMALQNINLHNTRQLYWKLKSIHILFTGLCIESWFVQHAPYFVHRGVSKPSEKLDNFECSRQQANA